MCVGGRGCRKKGVHFCSNGTLTAPVTTAIGEAHSLMEYGDDGSDGILPDELPALLKKKDVTHQDQRPSDAT